MSARRWSLLCSLLLTAVLLYAFPELVSGSLRRDPNRMDVRLRPARTRTLTVWVMRGGVEDQRLLNEACTAFEDSHKGVRVFLRAVGAEDWASPDAVLPDVALLATGSLTAPERFLLPLASDHSDEPSGCWQGQRYAIPLWLEPSVLSLPQSWLETGDRPAATPTPDALIRLATPTPDAKAEAPGASLAADALPWRRLLAPGALRLGSGVALQQLAYTCPAALRGELRAQTQAEPLAQQAQVLTLQQHLAQVRGGAALAACPLLPATSDRVRYAALCRDGADARAFLRFLREEIMPRAAAFALLPAQGDVPPDADPLTRELAALYTGSLALPNAFSHAAQERQSLCMDAFLRGSDPVETLLRLR